MSMPSNQKIYHIVHKGRLQSIASDGGLLSDAIMSRRSAPGTVIGMDHIKLRRLHDLAIGIPENGMVGECVPFYFCPRSVMLCTIHHNEGKEDSKFAYKDGQKPIVHLVCDVNKVIEWARSQSRLWAFTSSSAATFYARFFFTEADFNKLNWTAIQARYWPNHRDEKQAEFLVRDNLPWSLVEEIGVYDETTKLEVEQSLANAEHKPIVRVHREWYY